MNVPIIKRKKKKKESCPHDLHFAKYLQTHKHDCKRSDQSAVIKSTDAFWACVSSSSIFGGSNDRSYLVIHSLLFVACFWTFVSRLTAAAAFRRVHVTHSNTVRAEIEILTPLISRHAVFRDVRVLKSLFQCLQTLFDGRPKQNRKWGQIDWARRTKSIRGSRVYCLIISQRNTQSNSIW